MGSIGNNAPVGAPNIIDIRTDTAAISIKKEIISGLSVENGKEKRLPTLLLYDEKGLRLFEEITYLDEYYLTGQEIEVLQESSDRIADRIPGGSMVVELGSGNLRKVKILLDALDRAGKHVDYYALDLDRSELERTLAQVPEGGFRHVKCFGLWGTYDDGLEWLKSHENADKPKTILSIGSSIGNFHRDEAAQFLKQFAEILQPQDSLLVGIDACQDREKVFHAYNDRDGVTHRFILNGLINANKILGYEAFNLNDWKVVGGYDSATDRHQAFVMPTKDVEVEGVRIAKGEGVRIEHSYKYSGTQSDALWNAAGIVDYARWSNKAGNYALHMLNKPQVVLPMKPEQYAAHPVPSLADWRDLWASWDTVTKQMIPDEEVSSKPIKLRNACIFYFGHIPTFMDMHLTRATKGKPTEPAYYRSIFERGIDPDVDNPEDCHAHSEIPDTWPPVEEIFAFEQNVRKRIVSLYESCKVQSDRHVGRVMWFGFEHEAMHLETLLYMLVQSDRTLPPACTTKPDFDQLALQAKREAVDTQWFDVPEQTITIGLDDADDESGPFNYFGWDNEKPYRSARVPSFQAKGRPITIGEYAAYLEHSKIDRLPASWAMASDMNGHTNGTTNGHNNGDSNGTSGPSTSFLHGKTVRTVYGQIPLKLALDWPVAASYDEIRGCADYMGGRIPTMEEARSIYSYVDLMKKKEISKALGKTIPAVNGHLVNNGVEETPPSKPSFNGLYSTEAGPDPNEFHVDLEGTNVGFKHWHPMPVTQNGGRLSGQGDMGGVWEWTSTVLEKHEGFEPMALYPVYTADFFDTKHNVVLGGSWATHPRVAGRKTL